MRGTTQVSKEGEMVWTYAEEGIEDILDKGC